MHESQNSDDETLMDTDAQHDSIYAYDEYVNYGNEEPTRSTLPAVSTDEKTFLTFLKEADYRWFEIWGTSLDTHFSKVLEGSFLLNCLQWRIIQITLDFSKVPAEGGNIFSTNEAFDYCTALGETSSSYLAVELPEGFSFSIHSSVVG